MAPPSPLMRYLRVQEHAERDILAMMNRTASKLESEIRALSGTDRVGARLRRAQLQQTRETLRAEIAVLWERVGSTVMRDRTRAATAAGDVLADAAEIFRAAGLSGGDLAVMRRALQQSAASSVDAAMARMKLSKIPLSKRVYDSQKLLSGQVDRMIDHHLLRGSSAVEIARDVRQFISPSTPGGVKYAAQRLARTELNNAFHASTVYGMQNEPFVQHVRWHLSGSHPVPDECNEYAEKSHVRDGGAGVWAKADVPAKPHPQCLCYVTAVELDRDEFLQQFTAGEYDGWLATQLG